MTKDEIREKRRAYYQANREKIKKATLAHQKANPEKLKAYRDANKEKIAARDKARREADPEKRKAWLLANRESARLREKKCREKNPGKLGEAQKRWRERNKENIAAREKARRLENPDKFHAKEKAWRDKNPDKLHAYVLKHHYGLSPADLDRMLEAQGGGCAICGSADALRKGSKRLCIDHDHATGAIRGLLCHPCNVGLGAYRDDPKLLANAIQYLAQRADKK